MSFSPSQVTLWPLLTFSSQFLCTVMSCRISFPAFGLPVLLFFIASPSYFQVVLEDTYSGLDSPSCPYLVPVYKHLPCPVLPFIHTHPKIKQLGIKPVAVAGLGAGWGGMRVERLGASTSSVLSPCWYGSPAFPSVLVSKGLAPRKHTPHLIKCYCSH